MVETSLQIGPYQLHPVQGLSSGGREVRITPKSLAVLMALARQPGRIVTKQDLFRTVWAGTIVTDAALSSCIRELRLALDDDARNPRYIETVHRRGFRLLVNGVDYLPRQKLEKAPWASQHKAAHLPGRSDVIERLEELATRVQDSVSELALVMGGLGVGKSAMLRCMATRMSSRNTWLVCEISCKEPAMAYGPVLEMLERLREGPAGAAISSILRRHAGSWLAELPDRQTGPTGHLPDCSSGATTQWRNRELRQALTAISETSPLMICLDDLHRCDEATLEFILGIVREPGKARVLLLASWEGEPTGETGHYPESFRDLINSGRCAAFTLDMLDEHAVAECLDTRLSGVETDRPDGMAEAIVQSTCGWPLMIEARLVQWACNDPGKPPALTWQKTSLTKLVEQHLDRLGKTGRQMLEAASIVGERFSAAEVSAATGQSVDIVTDNISQALAELPLIVEDGFQTMPDGSKFRKFAFLHEKYQALLYEQVDGPNRVEMHRRVAHWMQKNLGHRADRDTVRLARHFEQAGELDDAARHWYQAGTVARRRGAHEIALKNFRRAKVLLDSLDQSPDRDLQSAKLCTALGREIVVTTGLDSPEANRLYRRALKLSTRIPASPELSQVLWRLWVFHLNRGPIDIAGEIADKLLDLARGMDDSALLVQAYHALWGTCFMRGDLPAVLEHSRAAIAVCGSGMNGSMTLTRGCTLHDAHLVDHNVAVCAGFFSAWVDAIAGRQEAAVKNLDAVIAHARDIKHPFTLALTLVITSGALAASGNAGLTRIRAAEARSIAKQHGFTALSAWAAIHEGWALAELGDTGEGMKLLENGLSAVGKFGMTLLRPFHLILAATAQMHCERLDDALRSLTEAFTVSESSGHRIALPELHRLRAEVTLRTASDPVSRRRAIGDLKSAAKIADAMGAHLWTKRAQAALDAQSESSQVRPQKKMGLLKKTPRQKTPRKSTRIISN